MKESIKIFAKEFIKPIIDILIYPIKVIFKWLLFIEDKYLVPAFIKLFPDCDPLKYLFIIMGFVLIIGVLKIIIDDCKMG